MENARRFWSAYAISSVGAIILALANISPPVAVANFGGWIKLILGITLPFWLVQTVTWVGVIGAILAIAALVVRTSFELAARGDLRVRSVTGGTHRDIMQEPRATEPSPPSTPGT